MKEVLPKVPLKLTENGLILQPADPDVLALPPLRKVLKKSMIRHGLSSADLVALAPLSMSL